MIVHQEEIFSRPKKTWFISDKEKKLVAKAAKVSTCCCICSNFVQESLGFSLLCDVVLGSYA